jgi:hypothetical protein
VHGMHAATSKVENLAQGSSCKLKFVHGESLIFASKAQNPTLELIRLDKLSKDKRTSLFCTFDKKAN